MIIGLISDTHRLLRPEAVSALEGCEHIVHAGDIGALEIIERLRKIAPVSAIRGNVDTGAWAEQFPTTATLQLAGKRIHVLHNLRELDRNPVAEGFDVVVCGHSHDPWAETRGGVLYVNPGSAGPRRFKLPVTVALMRISGREVSVHHVRLLDSARTASPPQHQ